VASLHLWLTLVRLRAEGEPGKRLGQARAHASQTLCPLALALALISLRCVHPQEVYDHFWADMEARVRNEGVVVRLSKWMRELEQSFYGSSAAFDAALAPDAPPGALQSALRRNVYMGEGVGADAARCARYVRHQLACLQLTPSEAVMAGALTRRCCADACVRAAR
jgi:hypothetical protein